MNNNILPVVTADASDVASRNGDGGVGEQELQWGCLTGTVGNTRRAILLRGICVVLARCCAMDETGLGLFRVG